MHTHGLTCFCPCPPEQLREGRVQRGQEAGGHHLRRRLRWGLPSRQPDASGEPAKKVMGWDGMGWDGNVLIPVRKLFACGGLSLSVSLFSLFLSSRFITTGSFSLSVSLRGNLSGLLCCLYYIFQFSVPVVLLPFVVYSQLPGERGGTSCLGSTDTFTNKCLRSNGGSS